MSVELAIRMLADGCFELVDETSAWRIVLEEQMGERPWSLMATDVSDTAQRGSFALYDSYESLDDALTGMVDAAFPDGRHFRYRVELPCGSSFIRPGRISSEQVMAGFGWVYVKKLVGYVLKAFPGSASILDVREGFRKTVQRGPRVVLGETSLVEVNADGSTHWCADIFAFHDGFVHSDEISNEALKAFSAIGDGLIPSFDFVPRAVVPANTAMILQFPQRTQTRSAA